jgi:hypothetical protein
MVYGRKNARKQYTGSLQTPEEEEFEEAPVYGGAYKHDLHSNTHGARNDGGFYNSAQNDPVASTGGVDASVPYNNPNLDGLPQASGSWGDFSAAERPPNMPVTEASVAEGFGQDQSRQWGSGFDPGGGYQDPSAPMYGSGGQAWDPTTGYGDDFAYGGSGDSSRPGMTYATGQIDSDALAAIANDPAFTGRDASDGGDGNQGLGDLDQEGSRETSSQAMYDRILDLLSGQGMDTSDVEASIMDQYRSDLGQGMGGLMAQMGGAGWGQSGLMGVHASDIQQQLSRQATQDIYNTRADARDQMLREYGQAASMAGAAGDLELQQMLIDLIQNEMDQGDEPVDPGPQGPFNDAVNTAGQILEDYGITPPGGVTMRREPSPGDKKIFSETGFDFYEDSEGNTYAVYVGGGMYGMGDGIGGDFSEVFDYIGNILGGK